MQDVVSLFKKRFGHTPTHQVQAPGRLEVLGNHTDYNHGLVMSVAVDKYIFIAAAPRNDGKVELVSSAFPEPEKFSISDIKHNPAASWANYVKGVLVQLKKRGVHFGGFNAAIHSTIPMGAGMSSSAALEVATAMTLRRLHPYSLTDTGITTPPQADARNQLPPVGPAERMNFAKVCRAAENEFVGVPCGILDQVSSLFGKSWNVMEIDCASLTVDHAPLAGIAMVVCNSEVKHALVGGEYKELRDNCESAARKLGVKFLRTVEPKQVLAAKDKLSQREFECAYHVTTEIARVVAAEKALRANDIAQFGQYMFQSHESSRDCLKNSTRELDTLVELARQHPACLGARLTGGGFGGATINMVKHHEVEGFIAHMVTSYEKKLGIKIHPLVCQVVDGAN
ncbi:MAG TPA: galactokinase family protein [Verrucomicrobiae bacterium]|nr:galactokinase family protein [Verrucomicrobiae bacterium]